MSQSSAECQDVLTPLSRAVNDGPMAGPNSSEVVEHRRDGASRAAYYGENGELVAYHAGTSASFQAQDRSAEQLTGGGGHAP